MRYAWIECNRADYAVSSMCRLLSVSRTGYLHGGVGRRARARRPMRGWMRRSLHNPRRGSTRHRRSDRRVLQSSTPAFLGWVRNAGTHRIQLHGCVNWCTLNRVKVTPTLPVVVGRAAAAVARATRALAEVCLFLLNSGLRSVRRSPTFVDARKCKRAKSLSWPGVDARRSCAQVVIRLDRFERRF